MSCYVKVPPPSPPLRETITPCFPDAFFCPRPRASKCLTYRLVLPTANIYQYDSSTSPLPVYTMANRFPLPFSPQISPTNEKEKKKKKKKNECPLDRSPKLSHDQVCSFMRLHPHPPFCSLVPPPLLLLLPPGRSVRPPPRSIREGAP